MKRSKIARKIILAGAKGLALGAIAALILYSLTGYIKLYVPVMLAVLIFVLVRKILKINRKIKQKLLEKGIECRRLSTWASSCRSIIVKTK